MPDIMSLVAPLTYSLQKNFELTRSFLSAMICTVLKATGLLPILFLRKTKSTTLHHFQNYLQTDIFQMVSVGIHKIRYSLLLAVWFWSSSFLSRIHILTEKSGECCVFSGYSWSPSLLKNELTSVTGEAMNSLHKKFLKVSKI